MNRIVLVGRLESTPDLRHTSTGIPVANFSLSVRRSIPNGQGRYERDIFRVVTWRKLAETCCRFLERGRMIAVDGKLQNRLLQAPNGDRRVIVEIHADDVRFLEGAKPRDDNGQPEREYIDNNGRDGNSEVSMSEDDNLDSEVIGPVDNGPAPETAVTANVTANDIEPAPDEADDEWFNDETDGTPLEF